MIKYQLRTCTSAIGNDNSAGRENKENLLAEFFSPIVVEEAVSDQLLSCLRYEETEISSKSGNPPGTAIAGLAGPHALVGVGVVHAPIKNSADELSREYVAANSAVGSRNVVYYLDPTYRGVGCLTIKSEKQLPPSWYLSMGLAGGGQNATNALVVIPERGDPNPNERRVYFYVKSGFNPARLVKLIVNRFTMFHRLRKEAIQRSFNRLVPSTWSIGNLAGWEAFKYTYVSNMPIDGSSWGVFVNSHDPLCNPLLSKGMEVDLALETIFNDGGNNNSVETWPTSLLDESFSTEEFAVTPVVVPTNPPHYFTASPVSAFGNAQYMQHIASQLLNSNGGTDNGPF